MPSLAGNLNLFLPAVLLSPPLSLRRSRAVPRPAAPGAVRRGTSARRLRNAQALEKGACYVLPARLSAGRARAVESRGRLLLVSGRSKPVILRQGGPSLPVARRHGNHPPRGP